MYAVCAISKARASLAKGCTCRAGVDWISCGIEKAGQTAC